MKKQFVPYEQALKLKELGFGEECLCRYCIETEWEKPTGKILLQNLDCILSQKNLVKAPLWQQAFDWFREEYNLMGIIGYNKSWKYSFLIETLEEHRTILVTDKIETYQEAQLACLDKLIEIVEQ